MPLPLYAKCPRCRGSGLLSAIVEAGNGWAPTRYGEFQCRTCGGTGDTDMDEIIAIAAEENEQRENVYVVGAKTLVPVSGYEARKIDNC
jgi:hypothetical protein